MATLQFSEEAARRLEAMYAGPDMQAQRDEMLRLLALRPGESVIDIGCGPGFLCENIAKAVGAGGCVLGIDVSDDLVQFARRRNRYDWLSYRTGDAMALDAPVGSFDVAVSIQVLEYLPDPDRAIQEMRRVLKAGGRALVVDTDWDGVVWHSDDPQRMKDVLKAWEAHCNDPRLPRTLGPRLRAAGFRIDGVSGYPIINTVLGDVSYSGGIVQLLIEFVKHKNAIPLMELDAWSTELRTLSEQGRYFMSTMRHCFRVTNVMAP